MAARQFSTRQLVKALRIYAKSKNKNFREKKHESKGSHRRIYLGDRRTTIPWSKDLKKGVVKAILERLQVDPDDFWPK